MFQFEDWANPFSYQACKAIMSARRYRIWFSTLVVYLCFSSVSLAEEIKISVLNFCPLHCIDDNGKLDSDNPGAVVEIYRKIYGDAGYQLIFEVLPFGRGMFEVRDGRLDAISLPLQFSRIELQAIKRQRPKIAPLYARLIYTKQTIGTHQSSCFFVRSDSDWVYEGENSFEGQLLGVASGHDYGPTMNAFIEKSKNRNGDSLIQVLSGNDVFIRNLKMLVNKRVDIVLINHTSGSNTIKQGEDKGDLPAGSVKLSQCIGDAQNLYLGFSDNNPERSKRLAGVFDEGIVRIRNSGELKALLDKYGLDDWVSN